MAVMVTGALAALLCYAPVPPCPSHSSSRKLFIHHKSAITLLTPAVSSGLPTLLSVKKPRGWRKGRDRRSKLPVMSSQPPPGETRSEPKAEGESDSGPSTSISIPTVSVIGLGAALVVGAFVLAPGRPSDWIKWAEEQIVASGDLAPLYFAVVYAAATVLFLPASFLTIAAGYLFGPALGTAVVSLSSTSGAALAFLIARYGARPLVTSYLAKDKRFLSMDRAIAADGQKIVFLWRLSPLFPFALSNYMFGLTGVGFWEYVGASWAGMLPATFAYVYLGGAGRATVEALSTGTAAGGEEPDVIKLLLYGVGALATLVIVSTVSKLATKVLKEAEEPVDAANK